jgi:predicted phage terminase large subunit-like protein
VWDFERRFIYIIDADIKRRLPDMLIADIQNYHHKRRYESFAFDADQPHGFMIDELGKRSGSKEPSLTIKQVKHETDKLARIQTLQPMIKDGSILFSRKHLKLLEQIRSFPAGKHDNILNALAMALEPCIQLSKIPVIIFFGVDPSGKITSKMKVTKKGWIPVPILEGEMAEGLPIRTNL